MKKPYQFERINQTLFKTFQKRLTKVENIREEEILRFNQLSTLGELSAGLTHEIMTPLTNIKLNLSMIKQQNGITDEISTALLGVNQIDSLVHNYLANLKADSITRNFNILNEVEKAQKLLEFKFRKEQVKLEIDIPSRAAIYGDPVKFNQVILNLLKNAIDAYSELDPADCFKVIEVKLFKEKDSIILKVIDFGQGVKEKYKDKIFKKFFTTKKRRGTGLGLPICRKIIEKHFKGRLELESLKNPTIFTINIPA